VPPADLDISPSDTTALDLRREVEELHRSRARVLQATDADRRRLERDLHDGAQQRLIAVVQRLRLALLSLETDQNGVSTLLRTSLEQLVLANEELRAVARGLDPIRLHDGLDAALVTLAESSLVPVNLDVAAGDLPEPVSVAVYYVAAEALANATKHAHADSVAVCVSVADGRVVAEVADDGRGGATVGAGTGLVGLADRVEALGGSLTVTSPPGAGTRVRAEIPLGL
jgi:signal transduction histidine kinase